MPLVALVPAAVSLPLLVPLASAQSPGSQDTSFDASVSNETVFTVGLRLTITGAEEIFAGGDNRVLQIYLLDGVADSTFTDVASFGGTNRNVYTQAFETTVPGTDVGTVGSRIYIGGLFGQFMSTDIRANIRRLNPDGTLDTTFDPGLGAQGEVTAILPSGQVGGGLLVGGVFTSFNNVTHNHLVRLNTDGSVDTTFNPNLQTSDTVFVLAAQLDGTTGLPNGQSLVGGAFGRINQSKPGILARLNVDGTVDTTFNPVFNTNLPNRVLAIAVQPDGKILAGGIFGKVNGLNVNNLVRLNPDGTTDPTFNGSITGNIEPVNAPPTAVNAIKILPDGRIYVAGNFTEADGVHRMNLARLEADGSLDASFDPGSLLQNTVQSIDVQSDLNVVIGETRINTALPDGSFPQVLGRVIGGPLLPSEVSITATKPTARKGARPGGAGIKNGRFELVRSLPIVEPLTVFFSIASDAGAGILGRDYSLPDDVIVSDPNNPTLTTNSITFPANVAAVEIPVVPKTKSVQGVPATTATLVLSNNSTYTVGSGNSATVTILPPRSR